MPAPTPTSHDDDSNYDDTCSGLETFRASLRSTDNEDAKFATCLSMRNDLLDKHTQVLSVFHQVEKVMVEESQLYRRRKSTWSKRADSDSDDKQWERFVTIAESGAGASATVKQQCRAPLTKARAYWGTDKVLHYGWASMGWNFCKLLGTAVARNPSWDEAVVKMNQLLLSQIASGHDLRASPNTITSVILEQLKLWTGQGHFVHKHGPPLPFQSLTRSELPPSHGFDQFGLLVQMEFACSSQSDTNSQDQDVTVGPAGHDIESARASPAPNCSISSLPTSPLTSVPTTPASPTPELDSIRAVEDDACPLVLQTSAVTANSRRKTRKPCAQPRVAPDSQPLVATEARKSLASPPRRSKRFVAAHSLVPNNQCTCSTAVTPNFLSTLDGQGSETLGDVEIATIYTTEKDLLCFEHLQKYATWATTSVLRARTPREGRASLQGLKRPVSNLWTDPQSISKRPRRLSLPGECLATSGTQPEDHTIIQSPRVGVFSALQPNSSYNPTGDLMFRQEVIAQLSRKVDKNKAPRTWGEFNTQTMLSLLARARPPTLCGDEVEVYYLTGEEAKDKLDSRAALDGPIVTKDQQQFKWGHGSRPIEQLFRRMSNPQRAVSVQKPLLKLAQPSCTSIRLGDVQEMFLKKTSDEPLNVLDLRNPLPRSVLPSFLTGEDCQLLGRVRDAFLEGHTAERCFANAEKWNKWRDDEDWVLLAQGGALTLTHQDSCGKATWLTVQEGQIGFGWMSRPSEEEMQQWSADPNGFVGGKLRYVVLHPGQTIYFEAGTVHFVFRLEQHQTLLVGGHVLRWSRVASWMKIVLNQLRFPDTTNEDVLASACIYVDLLEQLVSEQRRVGDRDQLGGDNAIACFFELKKEVDQQLAKLVQ